MPTWASLLSRANRESPDDLITFRTGRRDQWVVRQIENPMVTTVTNAASQASDSLAWNDRTV